MHPAPCVERNIVPSLPRSFPTCPESSFRGRLYRESRLELTRQLDDSGQCLDSHLRRACTPKCGVSARRRVGMTRESGWRAFHLSFPTCPEFSFRGRLYRESRTELTQQLGSFGQCLDSHLRRVGMTRESGWCAFHLSFPNAFVGNPDWN